MNKDLEHVIQQEVDAIGYDVVLLRQGGTKSRPVLELRIDRRDGERVSIADCVRVSRAVEARLDAAPGDAAPFGGRRYELQVSSPGDAPRTADASARGSVGATPSSPSSTTQGGVGPHTIGQKQPDKSTHESAGWHAMPADVHTDDGSRNGRFD
jgi:ribosome maturation factor RimP